MLSYIIGGSFIGTCLWYGFYKIMTHDVKNSDYKDIVFFQCIVSGILLGGLGGAIFRKSFIEFITIH